jgi:hypothetical protein
LKDVETMEYFLPVETNSWKKLKRMYQTIAIKKKPQKNKKKTISF